MTANALTRWTTACSSWVIVGVMISGCHRSRLLECEELTSAIAEGSSNAMTSSSSVPAFRSALRAAAGQARDVPLRPAHVAGERDIDLAEPRDQYVATLLAASEKVENPGHSPARSKLIKATSDAVAAIGLRCSGER